MDIVVHLNIIFSTIILYIILYYINNMLYWEMAH